MQFDIDVKSALNEREEGEVASLGLDFRDPKKMEELVQAARANMDRLGGRVVEAPSNRYKLSRYDIPVALAGGGALLFNARTRSLTLLSPTETKAYRALDGLGAFTHDKVPDRLFLRTLLGSGHVVGENDDELAWVRRAYDGARNRKNALNLTIAPTMACNFACGYCYQGLDKPVTKMSPEVVERIFTFIKGRANLQSLNVVWYGGEPLMGKEAVFQLSDRLIAYCDKNKIAYSAGMVSNSYLLTPDIARQLYSRRVKWVQVTLDGDQETHDQMRPLTSGHGTYDTIVRNIEGVLDETPISINVRVNVGQKNIARVDAMLDQLAAKKLAERGRIRIYFAKIESSTPESGEAAAHLVSRLDFSRSVLELEEKARNLKLAGIMAPSGGFSGICVAAAAGGYVIAGNGDLHKCWETAHDPSKRIGSLFELEKLDTSVTASVWREWTPFDNDTCTSCKILPMCGGHCAQRFIYSTADQTALPCPSWKWNTAEYIFSRALSLGVVKKDQWLDSETTVLARQSGQTHTLTSLEQAQTRVLEKVGRKHGRTLDRATLMAGELAMEEGVKA